MQKLRKIYEDNAYLFKKVTEDMISPRSTEAAFYLIISLVPLVMFLLSLLRYIIPIDLVELEKLLSVHLPEGISYWINAIVASIYTDASISLTSLTAITTIWAASKAVFALAKALCQIYGQDKNSHIIALSIRSFISTIIISLVIVINLIILVFSQQVIALIKQYAPKALLWINELIPLSLIVVVIFMTVVFAILYKGLGLNKDPLINQLPGAFIASLGWLIFSKFFYIYVNNFADYSLIYGSLTTAIVLLLWLKTCMMILLYGAEFNSLIKIYKQNKSATAQ